MKIIFSFDLSVFSKFRSTVSVTVMLATSLCWCLYDGDWFQMLVAKSLCWRLFSLCWRFSLCIKSVTNILNRLPTFQTCHQHIWSPTSVTNIDVTNSAFHTIEVFGAKFICYNAIVKCVVFCFLKFNFVSDLVHG